MTETPKIFTSTPALSYSEIATKIRLLRGEVDGLGLDEIRERLAALADEVDAAQENSADTQTISIPSNSSLDLGGAPI